MKIEDAHPVARAYQAAARQDATRRRRAGAATARDVADKAEILGIPEAELTDMVRVAIGTLLDEVDGLKRELRGAKERLAALETLADADGLTPLLNRRAFVRELGRMMAHSRRYGMPASLIYFDLNGFKTINDRYGHSAGDEALIHVAKLLVEQTRASDVVGRLGGDEFGIVLAQANDEVAHAKAEALRDAIAAHPLQWHDKSIPLAASYGIHTFRPETEPNQALVEADRSMYLNKDAQRLPPPG